MPRMLAMARASYGPCWSSMSSGLEPYTHAYFLHSMLRAALAHLYGEKVASLYSFHSFRSGLASALHAAGVADTWRTP